MKRTKKEHLDTKGQSIGWPIFLFLGIFLLGLTACADEEDDPQNPVTEQDRMFAVAATYSNLAEIEMGQLAIEKTGNESIRNFGTMMVTDHTNAQNQLATIAGNRDIDISDTLRAEHQTLYDQLFELEGEDFDRAYISSQIEAHQQAQQIFQTQIEEGSQTQLREFASNTLPHINAHLERAMELRDEVSLGE